MHQGNLELFLIFLLAAVIAVPLFRRFGLGAVLGYLFAGLLMGPFGLRVVKDPAAVLSFSELGDENDQVQRRVLFVDEARLILSPVAAFANKKPRSGGAFSLQAGCAAAYITGVPT